MSLSDPFFNSLWAECRHGNYPCYTLEEKVSKLLELDVGYCLLPSYLPLDSIFPASSRSQVARAVSPIPDL